MSSTINSIAQNNDMQAMIVSMFNKINNATISAGQNKTDEKSISSVDFVKALEKQLQKSTESVNENNQNSNNQVGMPAGMKIDEDNNLIKESYKELLQSIMENLDENSDGKISQDEMKNFVNKISQSGNTETTGTLASSKAFDFIKNQAGTFIQKLIDNYKDNGGSISGIFV